MTREQAFLEPRAVRSLRWTTATVCVLALHAAAAATILSRPREFDADSAGSVAIELAPITAGIALDISDLAPGPLLQEQQASEKTQKRVAEPVEQTLPIEPSLLAPNPEVAAAPKRPEKETPEDKKAEQAEQEQPVQAPPVPETTAPPRIDAPPSETAAAPVAGLSTIAAQAQATWHKEISSRINRYKRYPTGARAQGLVKLQFTLDRAGEVLRSQVVQSSGSSLLDAEAIAMLQRARPLPLPPPQTPGSTFELILPISFELR
jgi:periplasmic protein TonB